MNNLIVFSIIGAIFIHLSSEYYHIYLEKVINKNSDEFKKVKKLKFCISLISFLLLNILFFSYIPFNNLNILLLLGLNFLLSASIFDLFKYELPDTLTLTGFFLILSYQLLNGFNIIVILGDALIVTIPFLILIYVTQGKVLGGGDLRLFLSFGTLLGIKMSYFAIFFPSIYSALIITLPLLLIKWVKGQKEINTMIPFGPFLFVGLVITLFGYTYFENMVYLTIGI